MYSFQSLDKYREQLRTLDQDHKSLQAELQEWRTRFNAEKTNFLILIFMQFSLLIGLLLVGVAIVASRECCYGVFIISICYWMYETKGAGPGRISLLTIFITTLIAAVYFIHRRSYVSNNGALMIFNSITMFLLTGRLASKCAMLENI